MATSKPRHFIYPLNPRSSVGYVFRDEEGNEYPTNFEGFCASVRFDKPDEWGLVTGFNMIQPGDWVWGYFSKPDGHIRIAGTVRKVPHPAEEWEGVAIWIDWDHELFDALAESPIPYEAFQQRVQGAVCSANARTQLVLDKWLKTHRSAAANRRSDEVSFVSREVAARLGQPQFRRELLAAYGSRCAISGCDVTEILEAAHLQAVAAGGTHSVRNGLLLRADLHTLLDCGHITISDDLRVVISDALQETEYGEYHGRKLRLPSRQSDAPTLKSVRHHRRLHAGR